jgi:hypothetical protein
MFRSNVVICGLRIHGDGRKWLADFMDDCGNNVDRFAGLPVTDCLSNASRADERLFTSAGR